MKLTLGPIRSVSYYDYYHYNNNILISMMWKNCINISAQCIKNNFILIRADIR